MTALVKTSAMRPAKRWATPLFTLALIGLALAQPLTPISSDPRLATVLLALLLGISIKTKSTKQQHNLAAPILPAATAPVILAAWLLLSAAWSSAPISRVLPQIAFLCMLVLLIKASIQRDIDIQSAIAVVGLGVIGVSAYLWLVAPSETLVAGRLSGMMSNPLALASTILLTTPAIACWKRGSWTVWVISFGMVWLTGSRTVFLALLIAFALTIFGKADLGGKIGIIGVLAIAAYLVIPSLVQEASGAGAGSATILRSNNSHVFVWERGWELSQQHIIRGSGLGSLADETGSSVLAVLIVGGAVGIVSATVALFVAFRSQRSLSDWRFVTVAAGSVGALTEGWLISAGTIFSAIYWICVVSLIVYPTRKGK